MFGKRKVEDISESDCRAYLDVKTVSEKLGHSSIEITLKLYVHSDEDAQKAANEKFTSLVWNG